MVAKLFEELLGKSMEAYVDDMLVKNREDATHADELAEVDWQPSAAFYRSQATGCYHSLKLSSEGRGLNGRLSSRRPSRT